ncbi:MAG: hypothetical protein U0232_07790 [Thermomicrobiales bacterium]
MTAVLPLILVVDDNPWFREFLEDGFRGGLSGDGGGAGEALAAASVESPACWRCSMR